MLPLGGQTEIDGAPVDFGFLARPLGDPPDPGGGFGAPGRCGCWRPTWPQGLRGVRVGEASHPGPGGGGSAATRHRRHERKMQQALVAIIDMLLAVIGGIAGDDHPAKHQVAGIRGLLEVLREEPEADDDEDGFLPPPWRKVTFDAEPVVQTFEAPGPMKPVPERKGGGKGGKVDKGAGKAPIAEAKGGMHGERASSSSGDRRDKGGKKGGGKQAVPASGKGKQPAAKAGPDSSKHGKLRQQDWQGTLIDYDKACAQLNSLSGAVVVPVADAEQADALSQMLLGAGTKCSARLLWQDSKGGITAPAVTEEGVAVLHFAHRDYVTAGVALPAIRGAPSSPKKVPATPTTTVMRIVFAKDLVTKDVWSAVARAPRAAVQKWGRGLATGSTESFVKDAWGFAQETRAGMEAVVGLVRVPAARAGEALKASGGGGVFLEPAARDNLVKCGIEWIDTKEDETVSQAVARAKASAPLFGVFLGKRQVGMRVEAEEASQDNRVRFFSMKNTPASWSDDLVKEIIADQTALQQVSVHRKLTRNGRATWFLKARSPVEDGCHMLQVADGEDTHTYWMLPVRGEQARASKPIRERGAFVFDRRGDVKTDTGVDKPAAGASAGDGEEPPAKKPAVNRKHRAVPDGMTVDKVDGDGNCFYTVVGCALGRLRGSPALPPARVRAEVCAHMRKHSAVYTALWDGKDSRDQPLADFEAYVRHMESTGVWAGSLEAYAAAKAYKLAVYIIPAPLDITAAAYNGGAKDQIALWFTDKPGHFDWLRPVAGNELPEAVKALASGTQPGSFPQGGGGEHEADGQSEATVFTGFGCAGGRQEDDSRSEATVFTSFEVDNVDTAAAGASAALPAGDLEGAGSHLCPSPKGASIKDWFTAARRAGSEAFTGRRSAASASIADFSEDLLVGEDAVEDPPRPAEARKGRGLKLRAKHASWRCPECGWDTGRSRLWAQKKAAHIANLHPDIKQELNLRHAVIQMVPYSADTCCWRCPVPGCNLGLPLAESNTDARLRARRAHAARYHPDQPIQLFLLQTGTASGARKATVAKLSAGAARRIQQFKAGEAGDHDVICVRLPPTDKGAVNKHGKRRRALTKIICRKCKRVAQTPKEIAEHPCRLVVGGRRSSLQQRLQEKLAGGDLDEDILDGVKRALAIFEAEDDRALQEHRLRALAWPVSTKDFIVKFVCAACGGIWTKLGEAEGRTCNPATTRVRYREAANLRQLAGHPGVVGETATIALDYLHERGYVRGDERTELARGLGQHV